MNKRLTCNCSVVGGELGVLVGACGVGLRLRFLDGCCPCCGDRVLFGLAVIGDVALVDVPEWLFNVLRADGGDLFY